MQTEKLQERVEFLEQSLRFIMARFDDQKPAQKSTVSEVLKAEERSIALRIETCPAVVHEQGAWSILLAAYRGHETGRSFPVTALGSFSHAPSTTALRWLNQLTEAGLLVRRRNPSDQRSSHLEISAKGVEMMREYGSRVLAET